MMNLLKGASAATLGLLGAALLLPEPASAAAYRLNFTQPERDNPAGASASQVSADFIDRDGGVTITFRLRPGGDAGYKNEYLHTVWLNYDGAGIGSFGDQPKAMTNAAVGMDRWSTPREGVYDVLFSFNTSGYGDGRNRVDGGETVEVFVPGASARGFMASSVNGRDADYYGLVRVNDALSGSRVRMGAAEVAPIPLPAAFLLFGPALAGLFAFGRYRARRTA